MEQSFFDCMYSRSIFILHSNDEKLFHVIIVHHKTLGRLILSVHKIYENPFLFRIDFVGRIIFWF